MEDTPTPVKRPVGRPRILRDNSEEGLRTEGIRGRTRKRKGGQAKDKFAIPDEFRQVGTSYEWKRASVYGKEDYGHIIEMREQGWEPVDAKMMPGFMRDDYDGPVIRDGLILMERPQELTDEARAEDRLDAKNQVRIKEAQLVESGPGQFARDKNISGVKHSYERGEIPVE